jgi:hypothetical protein
MLRPCPRVHAPQGCRRPSIGGSYSGLRVECNRRAGSMNKPVTKRHPMIDMAEFERRLRQSSGNQTEDDPLAELARLTSGQQDSVQTCSLTLVSFQPMRRAVHHWQARSLTCSSADCVSAYILPPTFMFALKAPPSSSSRKCLRSVGSLILS